MPVFDKTPTVAELIEALKACEPTAMVVLDVGYYGPDAIGGLFEGYVKSPPATRGMEWNSEASAGYARAIALVKPS